MPPSPVISRSARLRSATTRAPSSSDNAPATHAAAISPWECPITAAGVTPQDRHTAARETITAHSNGCTTSTRVRSSSGTSVSDQSTYGDSARSHSAIERANTADSAVSCRAIPAH